MKKILLSALGFLCFSAAFSQTELEFTYDAAGNQIFRGPVSSNRPSKVTDSTAIVKTNQEKDLADKSNYDLKDKGYAIEISASPNPTTDRLTVQWKNTKQVHFTQMFLYTYGHKLLQSSKLIAEQETLNLSLGRYPQGIYILAFYTNKNRKQSYRIIKK